MMELARKRRCVAAVTIVLTSGGASPSRKRGFKSRNAAATSEAVMRTVPFTTTSGPMRALLPAVSRTGRTHYMQDTAPQGPRKLRNLPVTARGGLPAHHLMLQRRIAELALP